MTSLLDNLPPWPQLSFVLAKQVLKLDVANSFLTAPETESFYQSLSSFDCWKEFISNEQLTTFRVRAMLSEQFIPYFFHQRPCCRLPFDLVELCKQAHSLQDKSSPMPMSVAPGEPLLPNNTDHVPLLDIYHTLEFDMAAMVEQRKLDEYQAQEEVHEDDPTTTFTILDDSDHFSLKYLLKGISENRNKTSLSDRELRNLLLDVKPHRSKWANDDRIGQEDLYEACEKVLTELKNYTEHSTPFLSKVNKREAPDYFEVIKDPMDLGTVAKKLKHCQYKNKKEFGNDLYLIYENCLTYNTNPASEYRKHAIAMKRKTDRLLARVPEISIKERLDDMEDLDDSDDEELKRDSTRERSMTHESFEETTQHHHHYYGGKHPQKGTPLKPLTEIDKEHEELSMTNEIDTDKGELQNQIWREITKKTRAKLTTDVEKQYQFEFGNRQAVHRSSVDMKRFSMLEHLHHQPECTKKLIRCSRTAFVRWIDRNEGSSVYDQFDLTSEDEDGFDGGFFFNSTKNFERPPATDEDDAIRTDLFLPEYYMASGVPDIVGVPEEYFPFDDSEDEDEDTLPSLDIYPATRPDPNGLLDIMEANIKKLQANKFIYDKCTSIRNNIPISLELPSTVSHDSPPPMIDTGTPIPSSSHQTAPPSIIVTQEASHQMLQRSLSQVLEHAGFEGAHSTALNVLTDLMGEYFTNIGKTARKYWDEHGKDMSGEDILLHTLQENNVDSINTLDTYVSEDIHKYTHRLNDTHRKLESAYQDLITQSISETADDESDLFQAEEAFITGVFGEDLGEDFFGFKELGLDQECNMKSLSVPSQLWFGKDKPQPMVNTKPEPKTKYTAPPAFLPFTSITPIIGLLKPWYETRINKPEDEYIVQKRGNRPRYPPVNVRSAYVQHQQLQTSKRRVLKDGSNTNQANEEAKRKRKRAMEESKAQKKKQKLEIKAQKLAEKEQKKKLREEEKLAKKKSAHV